MAFKNPIFTVRTKNTNLPKASFFSELDQELKSQFKDNEISLPGDTPIFRVRNKSEWRLVSESRATANAYRLVLEYNAEEDSEIISVYTDTLTGLPKDVWDFKIFSTDLVYHKSKKPIYFDASMRKSLSSKQKKKWDFFFRPNTSLLAKKFDTLINRYEEDYLKIKSKITRSIGCCIILFLILLYTYIAFKYIGIGKGFMALFIFTIYSIAFFFLVTKSTISINIAMLRNEFNIIKSYLEGYNLEKEFAFKQLDEIEIPSKNQVLNWMNEEYDLLHSSAKSKFYFPNQQPPEVKTVMTSAFSQPEFKEIRQRFPDMINSFYAIKSINGNITYSGQYILLIFMTNDMLGLSTMYYDFILGKKYIEENKEYHYSDLVGIALKSKIINDPLENESKTNLEVNAIWLSFKDSREMEIILINENAPYEIEKKLEDKRDEQITISDDLLNDDSSTQDDISLDVSSVNHAHSIVRLLQQKKLDH
ncbi:MAG: hypothetical protein AAGA77_01975 [Bacteroidota bacterium]